jgi:hypothetical protein
MIQILPRSWPWTASAETIQPWPRRKGRQMTLIAGFRGRGGSVLCSDLLEVTGGYAKKPVDKISLSVDAVRPERLRFQFAIGCSGTGPYMEMLQAELARGLESLARDLQTRLDDLQQKVCDSLADCLVRFYAKHIWPRPAHAPSAEMQFLLLIQPCPCGECALIKIAETAVSLIKDQSYACIGIGAYLAEYILENMFSGTGDKEYQMSVAAYTLTEVNNNIDGCGHGYSIYHFADDGKMDWEFDAYRRDDFSGLKEILKYGFQTMTDVSADYTHSFSPVKVGELIGNERLSRVAALQKELDTRKKFQRLLGDKSVEG